MRVGREAGTPERSGLITAFLLLLQFLPALHDSPSRSRYLLAIDMRVAVDELIAKGIGHIAEVEGTLLLADRAIEDNVQEHIAQLFLDLFGTPREDRIRELIDLFEGIGTEALGRLLTIPRAVLTQTLHDIEETAHGRQLLFSTM